MAGAPRGSADAKRRRIPDRDLFGLIGYVERQARLRLASGLALSPSQFELGDRLRFPSVIAFVHHVPGGSASTADAVSAFIQDSPPSCPLCQKTIRRPCRSRRRGVRARFRPFRPDSGHSGHSDPPAAVVMATDGLHASFETALSRYEAFFPPPILATSLLATSCSTSLLAVRSAALVSFW